jgi:predicted ATPase
MLRGWALAEQGQGEEGIAQIHQGLATYQAIGSELVRTYYLGMLAEAYGTVGQVEEGLRTLDEALGLVQKNSERFCEAELYRLKGELSLQSGVRRPKSPAPSPSHPTPKRKRRRVFRRPLRLLAVGVRSRWSCAR